MNKSQTADEESSLTRSKSSLAIVAAIAAVAAMLVGAAPAAAQGKAFYGVIPQGGPPHLQERDWDLMQHAGVGSIKFIVNWKSHANNFSTLDSTIGKAAAHGIRPMPFIYQKPAPSNRAERRAMANFANAMANRYGPGGTFWQGPYRTWFPGSRPMPIVSWQILAEQNGRAYWGGRPSPRSYAQTLRMTTRAIRRAHGRAEIVLGGMFLDPKGKGSRTSIRYLRQFYRLKGIRVKRFFRTVSVHPYAENIRGVRQQIRRIRQVMRRHGHRNGLLRVGEFGWGSAVGGHRLHKGPQGQARLLRRSFRMFASNRNRWRLRGVHWFSWQDGLVGCPYCMSSGLVTTNRDLKPSYRAFRAITPP
jgi:hypothetical protein